MNPAKLIDLIEGGTLGTQNRPHDGGKPPFAAGNGAPMISFPVRRNFFLVKIFILV
jgi:hypothetical protein